MIKRKILILGGAGFIGSNAAAYFYKKGWRVTVADNFSRKTAHYNAAWLSTVGAFDFKKLDLRNEKGMIQLMAEGHFHMVLHLAGQVAVTTSVLNPREDFEINALGTLNVLEAIRKKSPQTFLALASTNKVYGALDSVGVLEKKTRYIFKKTNKGISEKQPLDFYSPYGCSKGTSDQYVTDYSRIYGLKTVVFRQSCIYGPRQFGVEDQGWLAWFVIAALKKKPITIYGSGKQVRDVLFIDDLVRLYMRAYERRNDCNGQAFNVGGGVRNTLSLLELIAQLNAIWHFDICPQFKSWRPGDQKVYISNISKAITVLKWKPKVTVSDGLKKIVAWFQAPGVLI